MNEQQRRLLAAIAARLNATAAGPAVSVTDKASAAKTAQASERDVTLARDALSKVADVPARWRDVAQSRIDYPGENWQQIADRLSVSYPGMTRYQAASCFRRLLVAAGLRQERVTPPDET